MNELDDLLNDLSTTSAVMYNGALPQKLQSQPASLVKQTTAQQSVKPDGLDTIDDLDVLLQDLDRQQPVAKLPSQPPSNMSKVNTSMRNQPQQNGTAIHEQAHQNLQTIIAAAPSSVRSSVIPPPNQQSAQSKDVCSDCHQPINVVADLLIAMGRQYHRQHFKCTGCQAALTQQQFFERNSQPYCQNCMNLQICAYCSEPIKGRCIQALDKQWHPDHFFCSQCGKHFPPGVSYLENDGKAYCEEDYYNMFAPKCAKCDLPIMDEVVSALGKSFHNNCFSCAEPGCKVLLTGGGSFFDHNGKPYCEQHYHQARGSLCASCMKPVVGRCLTAIGKKFHPEHFVCAYCKKQLTSAGVANSSSFRDHEGKPYCISCHVKLYG